MRSFIAAALVLAATLREALAATYTVTLSSTTTSSVRCSTYYKSTTVASIHTKYTSKNLPPDYVIFSSTSTPYNTITPKAVTSTFVSTAYTTTTSTLSTSVATFTETNTENDVSTTTSTSTSTEIDTVVMSTVVTSTSIVPSPSGFITVEDSTGLENESDNQDASLAANKAVAANVKSSKSKPKPLAGMFEASVVCVTSLQPTYTLEVIKVHSTVKTTVAPSTSTTTSITTSVATATIVATASTTVTTTVKSVSITTAIYLTTTTTSTTVTNTGTVSTSSYAACATNNILGPGQLTNGNYFYDFVNSNGNSVAFIDEAGDSGYNCCVACLGYGSCVAALGGTGGCLIVVTNNGSCPVGQPIAVEALQSRSDLKGYTVSNGPCGSASNGGRVY